MKTVEATEWSTSGPVAGQSDVVGGPRGPRVGRPPLIRGVPLVCAAYYRVIGKNVMLGFRNTSGRSGLERDDQSPRLDRYPSVTVYPVPLSSDV